MFILFRAVQALAMRIFLSFSVELISLPKYVNDSTDSVDPPETVCIEPCWLKLMKLVLRFIQRRSICCFLYIGSSNSGTTFHGGDGEWKDFFSPYFPLFGTHLVRGPRSAQFSLHQGKKC